MSQRARQNNTTLMSQPPISNSERNQLPSPPSNNFPQSSRNSDSERTISASPNDVPSPPTSPSNMPIVRPIGNNLFEPWRANKVIDYVTKIFPDAIKSYNDAPIHMKDVWFNEFRKKYKWNPEDEAVIQNIFHKKAARRLSDTLGKVRINLARDHATPNWMNDQVLAQYRSIWNTEEFKKTAAKNKRNRNSDCGGLGPSLHTAGSISISEHRKRLKEKLGEEPSHVVLFQATHKRKKTNEFVCKKANHVNNEAAIQKQQTQPELGESNAWFVAAGGLKKRGSVYGFGSDTPRYLAEAVTQKNSKFGQSWAHAVYEDQVKELKEENKKMKEKLAWLEVEFVAIHGANQPCFQYTNPAISHESSGVGLDDLEQ